MRQSHHFIGLIIGLAAAITAFSCTDDSEPSDGADGGRGGDEDTSTGGAGGAGGAGNNSTIGPRNCEGISNPLAQSCAQSILDGYECFQPEGTCTYELDDTGSATAVWLNGAVAEYFEPIGGSNTNLLTTFSGEGGVACGTVEIDTDIANTSIFSFQGEKVTQVLDPVTGDATYICENGDEVEVTASEKEAIDACYYQGDTAACEGASDLIGGGTQQCVTDDDCPLNGSVCCPFDYPLCVSQDACDVYLASVD